MHIFKRVKTYDEKTSNFQLHPFLPPQRPQLSNLLAISSRICLCISRYYASIVISGFMNFYFICWFPAWWRFCCLSSWVLPLPTSHLSSKLPILKGGGRKGWRKSEVLFYCILWSAHIWAKKKIKSQPALTVLSMLQIFIYPSQRSYKVGTRIILILQMRKLRHREFK